MSRNRMIKPEFWEDEKLSTLSSLARLIYIGMWNYSDDYGHVKGNLDYLWRNLDPYGKISRADFKNALNELKEAKRIFPYSVNGEQFYSIPNFLKHQKIDRPSKTVRNPNPPEEIRELESRAINARRGLDDEVEVEAEKETNIKDKVETEEASPAPSTSGKLYILNLFERVWNNMDTVEWSVQPHMDLDKEKSMIRKWLRDPSRDRGNLPDNEERMHTFIRNWLNRGFEYNRTKNKEE